MDNKTENIVQNVGAIAETTSIFYNSIIKQVPKDVALVLTQHFMDITITRRPAAPNVAVALAAQAIAAQRRAAEQRKNLQEAEQPQQTEQPKKPQAETQGERGLDGTPPEAK